MARIVQYPVAKRREFPIADSLRHQQQPGSRCRDVPVAPINSIKMLASFCSDYLLARSRFVAEPAGPIIFLNSVKLRCD
jgi:hypothetical protein